MSDLLQLCFDAFPYKNPDGSPRFYGHQRRMVASLAEALESGYRHLNLNSPPGSGKTAVATCISYVFSNHISPGKCYMMAPYVTLVDELSEREFGIQFPNHRKLKSREDFRCLRHPLLNCAACIAQWGERCPNMPTPNYTPAVICEYYRNVMEAIQARQVLMTHHAYWVRAFRMDRNHWLSLPQPSVAIVDEVDMLRDLVNEYFGLELSPAKLKSWGIDLPATRDPEQLLERVHMSVWARIRRLLRRGPLSQEHFRLLQELEELRLKLEHLLSRLESFRVYFHNGSIWFVTTNLHEYFSQLNSSLVVSLSATCTKRDLQLIFGLSPDEIFSANVPPHIPPRKLHLITPTTATPISSGNGKWDWAKYRDHQLSLCLEILRFHLGTLAKALVDPYKLEIKEWYARELARHGIKVYTHGVKSSHPMMECSPSPEAAVRSFNYSSSPSVLISTGIRRGVNFRYAMATLLVVLKAPFPDISHPTIAAFLDDPRYGAEWYRRTAANSLLQMAFRVMRDEHDFGPVIFLDSYCHELLQRYGFEWVRSSLRRMEMDQIKRLLLQNPFSMMGLISRLFKAVERMCAKLEAMDLSSQVESLKHAEDLVELEVIADEVCLDAVTVLRKGERVRVGPDTARRLIESGAARLVDRGLVDRGQ